MGIRLIVADYCENCPDFEPHVLKKCYMSGRHDSTVICVDADKCERLVQHVKGEGIKKQ